MTAAALTPEYLTAGGHPVPYVADWTGESVELLQWDPALGHFAIFTAGRRGDGAPVLGKMNPPRQRECMIHQRCQVCHCQLTPPLLAILWPGREVLHRGRRLPLLLEPFACAACVRVALAACPGLGRRRELLSVVAVRRHTLVMATVRPAGPLAKLKNLPAEGVVSYAKAILEEFEVASIDFGLGPPPPSPGPATEPATAADGLVAP